MGKIKSFEDLEVWQIGKDLIVPIYSLCKRFPKEEVFGLTSQVKRAALSVVANIAEGFGRFHYLDKAKFYLNARGSLYELKSHLLVAKELGFFENKDIQEILQKIENLSVKINNLIESTRRRAKQQ
ncbi:MAG: four helix bundle protein [Actinobacteria bacterium]|nr:four helix bundle protein [Actinomycetota bacterium]